MSKKKDANKNDFLSKSIRKKNILTTGEDILQNFILERLKNIIGLT
jgi:hypothetical protein